jgi:hypothetical protein
MLPRREPSPRSRRSAEGRRRHTRSGARTHLCGAWTDSRTRDTTRANARTTYPTASRSCTEDSDSGTTYDPPGPASHGA